MSEEAREGQPRRYCRSCEAEVRRQDAFCASCGERPPSEDRTLTRPRADLTQDGFATGNEERRNAGSNFGEVFDRVVQATYARLKEAYGAARARYRSRVGSQAAEPSDPELSMVGQGGSAPIGEASRRSILLEYFLRVVPIAGLLVTGLLVHVAYDQSRCIGCDGTNPKDKSHARLVSTALKLGVSNVAEKIEIEDVKVNGSSATVTVGGDVTDADARYLCNYALDSSWELQKNGQGAGGVRGRLSEAQVERPGLFNDTTCER